jgi:hypothetical protein
MFAYEPATVLPGVRAPIVAIRQAGGPPIDPAAIGGAEIATIDVTAPGHNLLRYRPAEVAAAIVGR